MLLCCFLVSVFLFCWIDDLWRPSAWFTTALERREGVSLWCHLASEEEKKKKKRSFFRPHRGVSGAREGKCLCQTSSSIKSFRASLPVAWENLVGGVTYEITCIESFRLFLLCFCCYLHRHPTFCGWDAFSFFPPLQIPIVTDVCGCCALSGAGGGKRRTGRSSFLFWQFSTCITFGPDARPWPSLLYGESSC